MTYRLDITKQAQNDLAFHLYIFVFLMVRWNTQTYLFQLV